MITIKKKIKRILHLVPVMSVCFSVDDSNLLEDSIESDLGKLILDKEFDKISKDEFFDCIESDPSNRWVNLNMEKLCDIRALKGEEEMLKYVGLQVINATT